MKAANNLPSLDDNFPVIMKHANFNGIINWQPYLERWDKGGENWCLSFPAAAAAGLSWGAGHWLPETKHQSWQVGWVSVTHFAYSQKLWETGHWTSVDAMSNHILLFSDTSKLFSKDNLEEEDAPISRPVSVGKLRVGNVYQVNV